MTGGDVINGGAGTDSLILSAAAAINTGVATITSIENITFIDNIAGAAGVAFTTSGSSLASVTLRNDNNAASTTTVNIDKSTVAVTLDTHTDGLVALVFGDASDSGSQSSTINYIGGKGDAGTNMSAAGIETITINASGSASKVGTLTFDAAKTVTINADEAMTIADLTLNAATTTLTITGDSKVTATAASTDGGLTAINVSGTATYVQGDALGGTAALVVTASGEAKLDVITGTATHKITGGSGADKISIGTTVMTTGTIDGGAGTADIIAISDATATVFATAPKARISNFEILEVSSGAALTFDFDALTGLTGLIIGTATSAAITNLSTAAAAAGVTVTGVQTTGLNVGVKNATNPGTVDTLKLTLDHVTASTAVTVAALTIAGTETLQIVSTGAGTNTNILDLASASRLSSVVVTGDSKFTLTDSANLAVELSVDASAATGSTITITMNENASGQTIKGSATTTNALTGGTGVDIITGGSGDDTINAGLGIGTIDVGTGSDIVVMTLATAEALNTNRITVTGFDVATDSIDGNGTAFSASGSADDLTAGGAISAEFAVISAAGSVAAVANTVAVVELSFEFSSGVNLGSGAAASLIGTNLLAALGATTGTTAGTITTNAADEDLFIIAYQSGDAFLYHGNGGATSNSTLEAAEINLIAQFKGVAVGAFTFADFI